MLCEKSLPLVGAISVQNGKICKSCASRIPKVMLETSENWADYTLQTAIDYEDEIYDKFEVTASYGSLHIDTVHGLFAISQKLNDDKPADRCVFSAYDLSEVAIYATSPKVDHGQVYVDVEFKARIENLRLPIKVIIKKKVHCQTKRTDPEHVTWEDPSDMSMFITLFNTMLSGLWENINRKLCGQTVHELEIEKARNLFMLPENYTMEELKKARNMMMKVYHPDVAEFDTTAASKIINNSFKLLKNELELDSASRKENF